MHIHKKRILKLLAKTLVFSLLILCLISTASLSKYISPIETITKQAQAQNSDGKDFKLSARTKVGQITLSSENNNFAANQPLEFNVTKGKSAGLAGVGQVTVDVWQNIVDIFGDAPENKIEIEIVNRGNEVVEKLDENYSDTNTSITIPSDNLIPGVYTLEITDVSSGTSFKQDFTWGVLAINTNKPTFLPGEAAKISMAVLNDRGMMVCDALVNLEIKNPDGQVVVLSTKNGNIKVNPECEKKDFTLKPDYEADYNTSKSGTYLLSLTAETGNGAYSITDTFEVKDNLDFDIERVSATRLYPANDYPVIIKVKANVNFQGVIEETVPSKFMVYYLTGSQLYEKFAISENLQKGLLQTQPGHIDGNKKTIEWKVDWVKGETYTLAYYFKPPEKSPDFFTLGALKLTKSNQEIFKEARLWQLANDAIATNLVVAWPSTVGTIPSGWQRVTALDSRYPRGVPNASTNPGSTGGSATHSHTTPAHSHTISHTHASATSGNAVGSVTAGTTSSLDLIGTVHTHTTGAIGATTDPSGTASPTSGSTSNDPAYLSVIWIEPTTTATGIPNNALAMYNTDAPANWAIYANSVNSYLKGATASGDGGGTGGSNTHSHTGEGSHTHSSSHTHPNRNSGASAGTNNSYATGTLASGDSHTHTVTVDSGNFGNSNTQTLNTSTDNNEPPFQQLAVIQNQTGANALPSGVIAIWRGTIANIPLAWKICDGNNSTPNLLGDFIKGATNTGEIGTTGGGTSHTHTGSNHTHTWASTAHTHAVTFISPPSAVRGTAGSTATWASATHTHTGTSGAAGAVTVGNAAPNLDTATHTPPYEEVAYIQYQPTDTFSGYVYTDTTEGTALVGASVCLAINGTHNAADCGTTDGTGNFSFMIAGDTVANNQLTFFIDGGTNFGNTVTVATGGDISTLKIYQNSVIVRHDQGTSITIAQMAAYDDDQNSTDMLFNALDSTNDTLSVEANIHLFVPATYTFDPNGTVTLASGTGDFDIRGTAYMDTNSNSIARDIKIGSAGILYVDANTTVNGGDVTVTTTGVINRSTGTGKLTMVGGGTVGGGSGNITLYDLETSTSGTTILSGSSTNTITNDITVGTGTTLQINNNVSIAGNFNNTTTGIISYSGTPTITMTGSSKTLGTGSGAISLYNLATTGTASVTFSGAGTNTVANNVTVGTGTTLNINSSVSIAGNLNNTTTGIIGTTSGTPTITMSGASKTLGTGSGAQTYYALSITGSVTFSGAGTNTVNNNVNVATGATFNINDSISIAGNLTNTTTGIIGTTAGTPTVTFTGSASIGGGSGAITFYNLATSGTGTSVFSGSGTNTVNNNVTVGTGTTLQINNSLSIGGNYSNSGTFTANSNTVTMTATGAGHTLGGTMTGSSSFYDLVFNDGGNSGAWTFGANPATVTNSLTITGGAVTAPSTTLTIGNDFSNSDGFTHNSGTIVFDNAGNVSTLTYSAPTTFNNFTVTTPGKQMQFDNDAQTNIAGLFNIQGVDCTTGRIFLDSDVNNSPWEIYVSGSHNIDYADVEDSTAVTAALTADNSTADNDSNVNWTINQLACAGPTPTPAGSNTNIRGDSRVRGGVRILYNLLKENIAYTESKWNQI